MKIRTYLIGGCLGLLLFTSCVVYKGEKTAPVTQNEVTAEETEAANLYNEGKYVDAITKLKDMLEKDPKNPVIWGQLGSVYAQINQFEYAEYALQQTLKYDPKNIKAMYNLSIVYTEKGDESKALKQVKKALKISPKNPLLQASLGNILIDTNETKKAKVVYERLVQTKPDFDLAHFNLGVINYKERNLDAAEKNYKDDLSLKPDDYEAKENLAAIYIIKANYAEAVDYLKQVIEANPDNDITLENAYYDMGVAYIRQDKKEDALKAFEEALRIEPWDMAAYVSAAIVSEQLGFKEKAIKYWQKYDRLLPVNKRKDEIKKRLARLKAGIIFDEGKQTAAEKTTKTAKNKTKKKKKQEAESITQTAEEIVIPPAPDETNVQQAGQAEKGKKEETTPETTPQDKSGEKSGSNQGEKQDNNNKGDNKN